MPNGISRVDRTALKINQGSIITLLIIAFALNLEWCVALVALVMIVGTVVPSAGAFKLIYTRLLLPRGILRPHIVEEDHIQHLFAQGLGGIFLAVSYYFLAVVHNPLAGWLLALLVVVLAFVNLSVNFCVGCYLYLRLRRISFLMRAAWRRVENE